MTENCLKLVVRSEAWMVVRCIKERGARRPRDWRAGNRRFLVAVRTPRLIADMIVNWFQKEDSELEKKLQASPKKSPACKLDDMAHQATPNFLSNPKIAEAEQSRDNIDSGLRISSRI